MKSSQIYRRAADLVGQEHELFEGLKFSCIAIEVAAYDTRGRYGAPAEVEWYAELFRPDFDDPDLGYYGGKSIGSAWGDLWGADALECRVLALLFMHQIALDEEGR